MSRDGDRVRLQHMLDAAERAARLVANRTRDDLGDDDVLLLALTRLIEIVGEASKAVSATTRARHPEIPWKAIAGTRDHLIHGYYNVDLNRLWSITTEDLPRLVPQLHAALAISDSP
jgi:uncharacterized protein with HEPN domain